MTSGVHSSVGKVSVKYSSRSETAAVLVHMNDVQDEDVEQHITDNIAPGEYETPVSLNQSQYEVVVEHRTMGQATGNPNAMFPLYEAVGYGGSSASSSLFYQYVPSKVRTLLRRHTIT